jgi:hypothetical protein
MPIPLKELIDKLPSDTAERVIKTKERQNNRVRNALRHETGLKLNRGVSEAEEGSSVAIPVKILPGLPAALSEFTIPDERRLAVILAPWRQQLQNLRDSSKAVMEGLIPQLLRERKGDFLLGGREAHLHPVRELAEQLLKESDKFDLAREILAVNEDVLGRYTFRKPNLFAEPDCQIELYWAVIGLIAMQIGVDVEDLTTVVLAHELAHAYTHRGYDIDGERWDFDLFSSLERKLMEGLAQHYTMLVSKRVASQAPGTLNAYRALLKCQPDDYRAQMSWEKEYSPEQVRFAMLRMRRSRETRFVQFENALLTSQSQLRRQSQPDSETVF